MANSHTDRTEQTEQARPSGVFKRLQELLESGKLLRPKTLRRVSNASDTSGLSWAEMARLGKLTSRQPFRRAR